VANRKSGTIPYDIKTLQDFARDVAPAVVYFLAVTYNITSSTIDYYYTQIIGNPKNVPIIKADKSFDVANTFGSWLAASTLPTGWALVAQTPFTAQ
jgi:hypothetical protein